ncbi:MAG TPA: tRNA 2-thiouridine(34) synthase MnmA [Gammaproteobacteria bacterium]|nr:tRNA 2-thiouridine(34) synthase MnmA [Gammaproteobacteria bacterium]
MKKPFVIVGMSGGVDSAVAAWLLLEQGYRVEGLFMKNWEETDDVAYCTAKQDLEDALQVCEELEIPLHQINFSQQYWDRVFSYFLEEYKAGRTPNPDIMCNKEIKFDVFLKYALKLGAEKIATGHYARLQQENSYHQLLKGRDPGKDQSYFLYRLGQNELRYCLFPVGEMQKPEVRKIATRCGFDNHEKKDSTGICFIGERRFRDFLARYLPARQGAILNLEGTVIGQHQGAFYYTMGQRQGLGIGGMKNTGESPWYVVAKDVRSNTLTVVQGEDHPALLKTRLHASQLHWIAQPLQKNELPFACRAKIRYRQADQDCTIEAMESQHLTVRFNRPQRAVTEGQSIVFYRDDVCLGGGVIESAFNEQ